MRHIAVQWASARIAMAALVDALDKLGLSPFLLTLEEVDIRGFYDLPGDDGAATALLLELGFSPDDARRVLTARHGPLALPYREPDTDFLRKCQVSEVWLVPQSERGK